MKATTAIHLLLTLKKVCTAKITNNSKWMVKLLLEGLRVLSKHDSDSDVNIWPISHYKVEKEARDKTNKNTNTFLHW